MADYSGAYQRHDPRDAEIADLKRRLAVYEKADLESKMLNLRFSMTAINGHVECDVCFALVREVKMKEHRDRCV